MIDAKSPPQLRPVIHTAESGAIARAVMTIPVGVSPFGLAIGPVGLHAYVANSGSGTVSVLDLGTLNATTSVAPFSSPTGVVVTPDNTRLYVTDSSTGAVSAALNDVFEVTANIAVGSSPFRIRLNPSGQLAYVSNRGSATVSVINTVRNAVVATVPVGAGPTGLAVAHTGLEVYVANQAANTLSVISAVTNTVVATVPGLNSPFGVALSPDSRRAYVANNAANTVSVIDTPSRTITATIPVGAGPRGVAASPDGLSVYTANFGSDTVSVIDTTTNTVTGTVAVGHQPVGIEVTPNSLDIVVTNSGANTVSVIQTLNQMAPTQGPQAGGTKVTITGTSLSGATSVKLGAIAAPVIANTANQIVVVSQPGSGIAQVTVTTPGGTSNPKPFSYYPSGDADVMAPDAGPTSGLNLVSINGAQLSTASQVLFGAVASIPTIVSDQQITVAVPFAAAPGVVPVTVTTAGGLTTGTLFYAYVDPPLFSGLSTTVGPAAGGNVIDLTGQDLTTTTKVTFNGVPAQYSIGSDTVLAAVVPPSPTAGPADVSVTTAGGTATLHAGYTYT